MKGRIIYCINFVWAGVVAYTFPVCFGLIYLFLTGHSKGYDYDLGAEKDISVMLGFVGLLIWLALALPSNIYVFRRTLSKGKAYLLIPALLYAALAVAGMAVVFGGWAEYSKEIFNV